MTIAVESILNRVASWPPEDVAALEDAARQIEAWRAGEYQPSASELNAIDEAMSELDNGTKATAEQVRAAFAAFLAE